MATLTSDVVNSISASLTGRASAAIDHLESQKTFMGEIFGNNLTVTQTQGAILMIRDTQIPRWKQSGLDIVTTGDESRVAQWGATGKEFEKAIAEIDGYGSDATLDSVVRATVAETKGQILPGLTIGMGMLFVGLAATALVYLIVLKKV